jgi:hydroxymethylbilane synthase
LYTIGTRGSDLALWQAHHVQDRLKAAGIETEIKIIKTQGDQIQHLSFDKMEGKGFFTKEIEAALLDKSIDIAVHSHKDLETTQPEGLSIVAVGERAAPNDVLLIRKSKYNLEGKWGLHEDALVGTSSARRSEQIKAALPKTTINMLRGNVPTRINKLREGQYDAILLARAGLDRLNLDVSDLELFDLDPRDFVSAPAQGALAIQMRAGENTEAVTKVLHHEHTAKNIHVEREILRGINGGCQVPFGAFCEWNETNEQHELSLFSMMDGKPFFAQHFSESTEKLIQLGLKDVLK